MHIFSSLFENSSKNVNQKMPYEIRSIVDFDQQLEDAGDQLVVVNFFTNWSVPCMLLTCKFEELSKQYINVKFLRVNVDTQIEISVAQEIRTIPTFRFFMNKQRLDDDLGANLAGLVNSLKKHDLPKPKLTTCQIC
ncbi:Thioredoxin 1 [Gigaspora margarita]|uniref:Thioredoxin 1 n=1 Tax=Gigaspora margarita TaxID=4874 RepID=A0A8H4ATB7_GIGMA|nr:Thioredoxin 1 [Gigaspora margarita]